MDWLTQRQDFITRTGFFVTAESLGAVVLATFTLSGVQSSLYVDDEFGDLAPGITALSLEVLLRGADDICSYDTQSAWRAAIGLDAAVRDRDWQAMRRAGAALLAAAGGIADQITDLDWQLNSGRAQTLRIMSTP